MASRKKPSNPLGLFRNYIHRCRVRNIFWDLSLEEFSRLTKGNCAYCEGEPAQERRGYIYNGLDRKNNKLGYTLDNVVPCCGRCNAVKSNHFTFTQMKAIGRILRILDHAEDAHRKKLKRAKVRRKASACPRKPRKPQLG